MNRVLCRKMLERNSLQQLSIRLSHIDSNLSKTLGKELVRIGSDTQPTGQSGGLNMSSHYDEGVRFVQRSNRPFITEFASIVLFEVKIC